MRNYNKCEGEKIIEEEENSTGLAEIVHHRIRTNQPNYVKKSRGRCCFRSPAEKVKSGLERIVNGGNESLKEAGRASVYTATWGAVGYISSYFIPIIGRLGRKGATILGATFGGYTYIAARKKRNETSWEVDNSFDDAITDIDEDVRESVRELKKRFNKFRKRLERETRKE